MSHTVTGGDDAPLDVEAGRVAPYSQLGDWVVLSGASSHACKLYWIFQMHVNYRRGDQTARPTRRVLADLLGFKLTKNVDPYITELETLGAITVIRGQRTMERGNIASKYIVHMEPPDGYGGLRSNADFYRARKAASLAAPAPKPQGKAATVKDNTAGQTPGTSSGTRGVEQGGASTSESATPSTSSGTTWSLERYHVNKKEVNNTKKNNHSPLRGECVYAHDAHACADAGTREDADHEPTRDDATDPWAEDRPTVNPGTRNRTSATPNPVVDDRPADNVDHAVNLTGCVAGDPVPTRLTRDWTPTPDLLAWAAANVPGLDLDHETDEFVHYWAVEAPARDPKSPRARRPKPWEKVDWGRAWQNRMRDQWRRQGLDRRPRPAAEELDLFADTDADTQPIADAITAWWGDQCRQRYGGVLPTALTKLRELVMQALVGGFDRDRIQAALVACARAGEPFPPQWILQRALTGQPPRPPATGTGGGMTRQEAEQREWDERFARKLEEAAEFDAIGDYSDEAIIGSILSKAVQRAADTRRPEEPGADAQVKIIRKEIAQ